MNQAMKLFRKHYPFLFPSQSNPSVFQENNSNYPEINMRPSTLPPPIKALSTDPFGAELMRKFSNCGCQTNKQTDTRPTTPDTEQHF